jgi:c-di-GMP-binding flagellar brake protein YcgR
MYIPIKIGEKLCIAIGGNNTKDIGSPVSQLIENCGNGEFVIAMPILKGRLVPLHIGTEIKIVYYRKNGIYSFRAKVTGRKGGRLPNLRIQAMSPPHKNQRRDYFRLNTVLTTNVFYKPQPESQHLADIKCVTLDISAGGLRLASNVEIKKDDYIICEINIMDKILSINGRVVRSTAVYNEEYEYEIGIQFIGLDEKTRLKLISFIFEEERKLKRKGLI